MEAQVGLNNEKKEKQRKVMGEILLQNELCYEKIIDNSDNGILIVANKKIAYANLTAAKVLGCKEVDSLIGKNMHDFIDCSVHKLRDGNNYSNFNEIKITTVDNKVINSECSIDNINYHNSLAYLVIIKDLNYKKELTSLQNELHESEEQLNKTHEYNKMLTEFFSNISHELKTPINVILSAVQLLMIQSSDEHNYSNVKEYRLYYIIRQNGYRLIRLINNLLDVSKYDTGYLNLNLKNYNIVKIVEDITMSVAEHIKLKGIQLVFDTDIEERIMAVDEDKIERILLNLLSNAVKFTDKGGEISVELENCEDYIKITVKDNGIGIPEDKLKMIFDRFAQVDKSLTRNKEGSGIGLSLVQTLIEMHGGTISVYSNIGEGSEFIIHLPTKIVDETVTESNFVPESKIEKILIEFSDIYS